MYWSTAVHYSVDINIQVVRGTPRRLVLGVARSMIPSGTLLEISRIFRGILQETLEFAEAVPYSEFLVESQGVVTIVLGNPVSNEISEF